jgi:sigma-E factor negative regulatory protein RseA
MTTSMSDQDYLAALVDGEPDTAGYALAIDAAVRDRHLRQRWERYLLIGQALRGEPLWRETYRLNERLAARLADEPTPIGSTRRGRHRPAVVQPAIALAAAAGLAGLAIALVPFLMETGPDTGAPLADAGDPAVDEAPARVATGISPVVQQWSPGQPSTTTPLDLLLIDHRERASGTGLTGLIPYAAVVGHGTHR